MPTSSSSYQPLDGFILTRQSQDRRVFPATDEHNVVILWLATDRGPVQLVYAGDEVQFLVAQADQERALQLFRQHGIRGRLRHSGLRSFSGEPLLSFSKKKIVAAGHATTVIIALTNTDDLASVELVKTGASEAGEKVIAFQK